MEDSIYEIRSKVTTYSPTGQLVQGSYLQCYLHAAVQEYGVSSEKPRPTKQRQPRFRSYPVPTGLFC